MARWLSASSPEWCPAEGPQCALSAPLRSSLALLTTGASLAASRAAVLPAGVTILGRGFAIEARRSAAALASLAASRICSHSTAWLSSSAEGASARRILALCISAVSVGTCVGPLVCTAIAACRRR
eukprot:scaffold69420_cov28-Tisochrysis_lutea.AAC.1